MKNRNFWDWLHSKYIKYWGLVLCALVILVVGVQAVIDYTSKKENGTPLNPFYHCETCADIELSSDQSTRFVTTESHELRGMVDGALRESVFSYYVIHDSEAHISYLVVDKYGGGVSVTPLDL